MAVVWKVRADCTYTTTANKTSRQAAVESLLASYPTAEAPTYAATIGRFPGGVTSQSTTRFTVAFDFEDADTAAAQAFYNALLSTVSTVARAQTLVSIHYASGF